tara:strand:+ start:86 stop:295 length:210 start_codon:yes stop_codon:yes gene_type:complete
VQSPNLPPGFRLVSGKQGPRSKDKEYIVAFRIKGEQPFIDWKTTYTRDQLVWVHDGGSFDVIAVKEAGN